MEWKVLQMNDFNIRKSLKGIYKRLGVAAQTKAFSFKTRDNKLDRAEDIRTKTCIAILEDYSRNKEKYHNPEYNTPDQAFDARAMTILNNVVLKTIESEGRKIEILEITDIKTDDKNEEGVEKDFTTNVDKIKFSRKRTMGGEMHKLYEKLDNKFAVNKLNDCIGRLPEKYREVIILFKTGYSYKEIAEQIKTDLGKIHNYIYRARINLAECMQLGGIGHAH